MSILLHNWFRRAAVFHNKHWMLGWLNLQHTEASFQSESTNIFRKEKHYRIFFLFPTALLSSASCSFFFNLIFFYTCRLLSFSIKLLHKADYKNKDGANGKAKAASATRVQICPQGQPGVAELPQLLPTSLSALWSSQSQNWIICPGLIKNKP